MNPQNTPLQQKTSFYYPLLLLPKVQREAMESLYRFCWAADDIADNSEPLKLKRKKLVLFKRNLTLALAGKSRDPLFQTFQKTIQQFKLSDKPLWRIVEGVERDLKPIRFKKFSELHRYTLQVAGGPGLASMEIFGFKDKAHQNYAENLGIFLQLVNITRDYREDIALGRQYFPEEDFKRFHLNPRQIDEKNSHWKSFVHFQLDRAWSYLQKARKSLTRQEQSRLGTAEAIASVYIKLHQKLKAYPHQILECRTSLSRFDKLLSVTGASARCFLWK
ncbi:MAG TPA: squalene/phytoene synthase family protein, partial [bacterium]|nr:squalene/phytoene synthase family protein [bacterium]